MSPRRCAAPPLRGIAAATAAGGEKTPAAPNVFELVFEAGWHETLHFPGVKGRLVDLCRPSQSRYNLAVTVAGGKDMDAAALQQLPCRGGRAGRGAAWAGRR